MGVAAAAVVGAVAGGVTQSMAAKKAARAQKKIARERIESQERIHEEGSASRERYSQMARGDQEIAQSNLLATEQARLNIMSSLGQPGTYGPGPGSVSGPIRLGMYGSPLGVSGIASGGDSLLTGSGRFTRYGSVSGEDVSLGGRGKGWEGRKPWEVSGAALDPTAMASEVQGTSGFRTVSAMVAEAEQFMNREGPAWDQLNNSVVGGIYESNAAFQREAMEQMSRSIASGGSARRLGLQMAQAFQIQERVNRNRTAQLWQAKLKLEEYRTTYAQGVTSFSQQWVSNQAGIRDSFTNALTSLQLHWSSTLAPSLVGSTVGAQSATQSGVLNASQGLVDAANTKFQASSALIETLVGAGQQILGAGISALMPEAGENE